MKPGVTGVVVSTSRNQEVFYLTMQSTHFIYGYMASDVWLRTILIVRKETHCCHIGYSFHLTARFFLYALSDRQDSTYRGLCYTSRGALAGTRNSSIVVSTYFNAYIHLRLKHAVLDTSAIWAVCPRQRVGCFRQVLVGEKSSFREQL